MMRNLTANQGFTLIELSIVLVIIGLIIGGVLVGQDLIRAAEVRATISQIEKYNTAVYTFRGKYGAMPGDIAARDAVNFGFTTVPTRAGTRGQGDGNGIIEGCHYVVLMGVDLFSFDGEAAFFWADLSSNAQLISGGFTASGADCSAPLFVTTTQMSNYVPEAKLGRGNHIFVYSGDGSYSGSGPSNFSNRGVNYFLIQSFSALSDGYAEGGEVSMSVMQAYAMDKKIDDGIAVTGRVQAASMDAFGQINLLSANDPDDATSCYNSTTGIYSMNVSGGNNPNCALSFRFQ